jgi:hypothetical protein
VDKNQNVRVLDRRSFQLHALIYRAPDLDDQWIAHCAEIDVISQGNSPAHAAHMIIEATSMCILDDLNDDFEPLDRGPNAEIAEKCAQILRHGTKLVNLLEAVRHQELLMVAIEWTRTAELCEVDQEDAPRGARPRS